MATSEGRGERRQGSGAAVFLDRDGVIVRNVVRDGKPYPPPSLEDLELLPGVEKAVSELDGAGYMIIVVTNQPDVATGKQARSVVEAMHRTLGRTLPIDGIKVCYHTDADDCDCRKPKPGMLLEAAGEWGIDLGRSYMIGDRWRDVAAGRRAGCRTIFIDRGYREKRPEAPDHTVASLAGAVSLILSSAPAPANGDPS